MHPLQVPQNGCGMISFKHSNWIFVATQQIESVFLPRWTLFAPCWHEMLFAYSLPQGAHNKKSEGFLCKKGVCFLLFNWFHSTRKALDTFFCLYLSLVIFHWTRHTSQLLLSHHEQATRNHFGWYPKHGLLHPQTCLKLFSHWCHPHQTLTSAPEFWCQPWWVSKMVQTILWHYPEKLLLKSLKIGFHAILSRTGLFL